MGSIYKEIAIHTSAEKAWAVVRDVGAVHRRFVPGLVTDTHLEPGANARIVTFANGMVVRELIVNIDDERRRFAYAAISDMFKHHNASMQVFDDGPGRCRLVWITDLLPDEAANAVGKIIDEGAAIMRRTLEREDPA
jgi:Polyketide cyclase / dehydrase and lipid transport